jgi:hypothetical protein
MVERRNCTKFTKREIESTLLVRSNTSWRKCEFRLNTVKNAHEEEKRCKYV